MDGTAETSSSTAAAPQAAPEPASAANAAAETPEPQAGDILDEDGKVEWSPSRPHPETGVYHDGEFPLNHRLRAEALADAGKDEDPDGVIEPDLIASTRERLAAEREAEEKRKAAELAAHPPVRANMSTASIEEIAADEKVDISGARNNQERVDLILAARGQEK